MRIEPALNALGLALKPPREPPDESAFVSNTRAELCTPGRAHEYHCYAQGLASLSRYWRMLRHSLADDAANPVGAQLRQRFD
jgi:hypothetical protein